MPCAPPRGGSSCFTAGPALPTRTAPRQDLWHRVAAALRFPLWGGSCFTSGPAWPTRTAPRQDARLAMAPSCHCQQLLTRAGFAHSHGAPPARRAPSYGTGLPLPAAADTGRLCPLARRRRAPSDGTGLPLPCAPPRGGSSCFTADTGRFCPLAHLHARARRPGKSRRCFSCRLELFAACIGHVLRRRRSSRVAPSKFPGVATAWPTLTLLRSVCTLRRYPKRPPLRRRAVRSVWAAPQARKAEPWRVPRSAVSITPRVFQVPLPAVARSADAHSHFLSAARGDATKPAGCRMGPGRDTPSPGVMA